MRNALQEQPTMVILRALALGDFLTALPALRALRRAFPEHRRLLTCPSWLRPLAHLTGAADELIDGALVGSQSGGLRVCWRPDDQQYRIPLEQAQLRGLAGAPEEPDLAVNLRGERVATHRVLLALRPRRLIGYRNSEVPETAGGPVWDPEEHELLRWCRLLEESGIPTDLRDLHFAPPDVPIPERATGATVIHPGAGSRARYWPTERWAAVIRAEVGAGRRVILTGGPHEVDLASQVAMAAGIEQAAIFAGCTDILEISAMVAAAARVICPDTGIAHLAVALGTPSVVLFGPMPPSRWGPPSHLPQHRSLWAGLAGEPYADTSDSGLLLISVEEVLAEVHMLDQMLQ